MSGTRLGVGGHWKWIAAIGVMGVRGICDHSYAYNCCSKGILRIRFVVYTAKGSIGSFNHP